MQLDYSIISGSQSHNISVVKTFKKCNPQDLKLYLSKLANKYFPHMV